MNMLRTTGIVILLATALCSLAWPAAAENLGPGGGTRIIAGDQRIGPYQVLATVSPEPAQVGVVTFVVRISDPVTGEKVRDAEVRIELVNPAGATLVGAATHADAGNPVDYAAHIRIEQPATYNGKILIRGPAGNAEISFIQPVLSPRTAATAVIVGIPFLIVLAVMAGFWYLRSGARKPRPT